MIGLSKQYIESSLDNVPSIGRSRIVDIAEPSLSISILARVIGRIVLCGIVWGHQFSVLSVPSTVQHLMIVECEMLSMSVHVTNLGGECRPAYMHTTAYMRL